MRSIFIFIFLGGFLVVLRGRGVERWGARGRIIAGGGVGFLGWSDGVDFRDWR